MEDRLNILYARFSSTADSSSERKKWSSDSLTSSSKSARRGEGDFDGTLAISPSGVQMESRGCSVASSRAVMSARPRPLSVDLEL